LEKELYSLDATEGVTHLISIRACAQKNKMPSGGLGGWRDLFTHPDCNADIIVITYGIFNISIPCVGGTLDTAEIPSFT